MHTANFKVNQFVFLFTALIGTTLAFRNLGLNNLGAEIRRQVQQDMAPLHARSSFKIPKIDLSYLDNLGPSIEQSVYEGLEPVRAMEIELKMKSGVGGITIVNYLSEGKKFIIKNDQMYKCSGSISDNGDCRGSLVPFKVKNHRDNCYVSNKFSIINDKICIGANVVNVNNNNVICESNTKVPAVLMTIKEFEKLCGEKRTIRYEYIADPKNPAHVEIPNKNKIVKCSNNKPGVCIFTETQTLPHSSGNILISSYVSQKSF